jgi:hypothetical protein
MNCTIFAYGQTGTGKTYTMFGEEVFIDGHPRYLLPESAKESWGLVPRMVQSLFFTLHGMEAAVTNHSSTGPESDGSEPDDSEQEDPDEDDEDCDDEHDGDGNDECDQVLTQSDDESPESNQTNEPKETASLPATDRVQDTCAEDPKQTPQATSEHGEQVAESPEQIEPTAPSTSSQTSQAQDQQENDVEQPVAEVDGDDGDSEQDQEQEQEQDGPVFDFAEAYGIEPDDVVSYVVHCSFLQIYNDQIYDLMQDPRKRRALRIREAPAKAGKHETFVQVRVRS